MPTNQPKSRAVAMRDDPRAIEYEAFDALPAPVRAALRETRLEMSAVDVATALRRNGYDPLWLARDILRVDAQHVAQMRRSGELPP